MPEPNKNRNSGVLWILIFTAVLASLCGLGIFGASSAINGREFSPNSFQWRTFRYTRVPWTKIRLTSTDLGTLNSVAPTDVLKHLATLPQAQRWHVIEVEGENGATHEANILYLALQQRNASGLSYWGAWSVDHPQRAAVFWPLVQQAAMERLYFCVPKLLDVAESSKDLDELECRSLQTLADAVIESGTSLRTAGDDPAMDTLVDWFMALPIQSVNTDTQAAVKTYRDKVVQSLR